MNYWKFIIILSISYDNKKNFGYIVIGFKGFFFKQKLVYNLLVISLLFRKATQVLRKKNNCS